MTADVTTPHDGARPPAPSDTSSSDTALSGTGPSGTAGSDAGWTAAAGFRRLSSPSLLVSLGLYVAAGGHMIASLAHLSHGWSITVFFLVAAGVQVVAAGRVVRGGGHVFLGALLAATLGMALLYLASRTINLPFGGVHTVHNDRPQDPDLLGTVVVVAELVTLAVGPALLPATARRWATNAMLLVGIAIWAAWGTGLL